MSFGKRPAQKNDREFRRPADDEPADRGKIMLVGVVAGAIGMMALFAFSDRLRLAVAARKVINGDKRTEFVSAAEGKGGAIRPAQSGKQGAPVVVDKSISRDDQGRTSQEVVRYSDGRVDTRDFTYASTTGKVERIVTRSRDGKLSITTFTP